jgi:uncharacterized protein YdeI (YjbR/CyaY-like superfamily)
VGEIGQTLLARSRQDWRAWLAANHRTAGEIWLLFFKKHSGLPGVALEEAVEEALCFGWIDSQLKRIDGEKHAVRFSPRKPGSVWSQSNKHRVERLIAQGRMTPAGLALVAAAKASGEWEQASLREDVTALPADLEAALAADPDAQAAFVRLSASQKKLLIFWVSDARRDETRRRRIHEGLRRLRETGRI